MIVGDAILSALQNEHAHRRRIDHSQVVDLVVGDDVAVILLEGLLALPCLPEANSPGPKVKHFIAANSVALAAPA